MVEKCRDQHPNLVITDIKMPDMGGIPENSAPSLLFPAHAAAGVDLGPRPPLIA
jgi:hypothetical protein